MKHMIECKVLRSRFPLLVIAGAMGLSTAVYALSAQDMSSDAARSAAEARGRQFKVSATVSSPSIVAVRIRHDMCPFCKGFDAKFPKLVRKVGDDSVLFVTLDMSDETTQKQAAMLVGSLGLDSVWTGDLSKMGTIQFVDGKTKQILSSAYQVDEETVLQALEEAMPASD